MKKLFLTLVVMALAFGAKVSAEESAKNYFYNVGDTVTYRCCKAGEPQDFSPCIITFNFPNSTATYPQIRRNRTYLDGLGRAEFVAGNVKVSETSVVLGTAYETYDDAMNTLPNKATHFYDVEVLRIPVDGESVEWNTGLNMGGDMYAQKWNMTAKYVFLYLTINGEDVALPALRVTREATFPQNDNLIEDRCVTTYWGFGMGKVLEYNIHNQIIGYNALVNDPPVVDPYGFIVL